MALRRLLWLFCVLGFVLTATAFGDGLDEMEQVAAKAGSINQFLARPDLQEEYYSAMQSYFGSTRVARSSYDAILLQLKELNEKSPAVGARLWETSGLGESFAIKLPVQSSGLRLKEDAWTKRFAEVAQELKEKAGSWFKLAPADQEARLGALIQNLSQEIQRFEETQKTLPRVERMLRAKEFYAGVCARVKDCEEGRAYIAWRELQSEKYRDPLLSGDADLVIDGWKKLLAGKDFAVGGREPSGAVKGVLLRGLLPELELPKLEMVYDVPTLKRKPAETDFFTVKTKTARNGELVPEGTMAANELRFRTLPRRLHGIWKGIMLGECVGGSCQALDSLTPERWATIALRDSRLYHVEQGGSYNGFVQVVPVEVDGKIYGSTEFGSPLLSKRIVQNTREGMRPQPLVNVVLREMHVRLPSLWKGLIVGTDNAINNAGVLGAVRSSRAYTFGKKLQGKAKHVDPLAAEIVRLSQPFRQGYAQNYSGNMITDATVKGQGELSQLRPSLDLKELKRQGSVDYLIRLLAAKDPEAAGRALEATDRLHLPVRYSAGDIEKIVPLLQKTSPKNQELLRKIFTDRGQADVESQNQIFQFLLREIENSPGSARDLGIQFYCNLLRRKEVTFPDADLDRLARFAIENNDPSLYAFLKNNGIFGRGALSEATREVLAKRFALFGNDPANHSVSLNNVIDADPPASREALRRFWNYLTESLDKPPNSLWHGHALAAKLGKKYSAELEPEMKRFRETALQKLRPTEILGSSLIAPFLESVDDTTLRKLPLEKLAAFSIFPFEEQRHAQAGSFPEKVQALISEATGRDPGKVIRAYLQAFEENVSDPIAKELKLQIPQELRLRQILMELAKSDFVKGNAENSEALFRFSLKNPNVRQEIELLPPLNADGSRPFRLRDPRSLAALLETSLKFSNGGAGRPSQKNMDLAKSLVGSLDREEAALFREERQKWVAKTGRLGDYLKVFPEDAGEAWFLEKAIPPTLEGEAFNNFIWDISAYSEKVRKFEVSKGSWAKLEPALLDPRVKNHSWLARALIEKRAAWPDDLLDRYLHRLLDQEHGPTKAELSDIMQIIKELAQNYPNASSPLWQRIRKLQLDRLIQSTYPELAVVVTEEEKEKILHAAAGRGDRSVVSLLRAIQLDDKEFKRPMAVWDRISVKTPAACDTLFAGIRRKLGF